MSNRMAESRRVTSVTSSASVIDTVKGSHNFVLKGYSLTKGMGTGSFIASKTFTVGGHEWAIYFYPDGKNSTDNDVYVSIYIALVSAGINVRALFELKLLDQSGTGNDLVHTHFGRNLQNGPYNLQNGPYTIRRRGCIWGYKRFMKRKDLEASTFLKDDCLKINCSVGVLVMSSIDSSMLNTIKVPESDIGADLGMMLDYEELCDVTFSVGGEKFRAHKLILTTRSIVFETLFSNSNGMGKDDPEIVLTDMEPKVFKALLHFIYRDTLMEDEEIFTWESSSLFSVFESFPAKLLAAAEKYDLSRLKMMCESVLCKDISTDSVSYILVLADRYSAAELKSICLKFSAENYDGAVSYLTLPPKSQFEFTVTKSGAFQYFRQNYPLLQAELQNYVVGLHKFTVHVQYCDGYTDHAKQPTLELGESAEVHLSDAENNKNKMLGISFKICDAEGN